MYRDHLLHLMNFKPEIDLAALITLCLALLVLYVQIYYGLVSPEHSFNGATQHRARDPRLKPSEQTLI